jgi:probable lipoprotein NlpC
VKFIFLVILIFLVAGFKQDFVFAAPLESGFALAPRASASPEERTQAYLQARQRVVEAARRYEGVPYLFGGMTSAGLDCSGFIGLSFRDALGITVPRTASGLYSWSERIPYERAQSGDFLFFRTSSNRSITHVAIYLGNRQFIHSASAGARTGVIISSLNETYWSNAFAGAGRAFPEAASSAIASSTATAVAANPGSRPNLVDGSSAGARASGQRETPSTGEGRLLLGVGFAPIWNGFLPGGGIFRGFSSQFLLGAETYSLGRRMLFGFEVRPEYDGALGVFHLPVTISWGPSEQIRIFAGPLLSFGEAALSIDDDSRYYSNGTTWLGTFGVTAAPFNFAAAGGSLSPYIELAWQSYFSNNANFNFAADFSAGFRFSTGFRWMMHVK